MNQTSEFLKTIVEKIECYGKMHSLENFPSVKKIKLSLQLKRTLKDTTRYNKIKETDAA